MRKLKIFIGICTGSVLFLLFQNFYPTSLDRQIRLYSDFKALGSFDPSIVQDPVDPAKFWMSYSAVVSSQQAPANKYVVSTRLAMAPAGVNGGFWLDAGEINPTTEVALPLPAPYDRGTFVNEVSALGYDPTANVNQKWKIMWMHYLIMNDERHFEHGWMGYKSASKPDQLKYAQEEKLFVGAAYNESDGPARIHLDRLHPDLNTCTLFSEPSLLGTADGLYVAMTCVASGSDQKIILIKLLPGADPTIAASWKYLGTVLSQTDASSYGATQGFTASNLFINRGQYYIIVTPQVPKPFANYYAGCKVFRFASIEQAQLAKIQLSPNYSMPMSMADIQGDAGSFNGACTYHPAAWGAGVIFSQRFFGQPNEFRIFKSFYNF